MEIGWCIGVIINWIAVKTNIGFTLWWRCWGVICTCIRKWEWGNHIIFVLEHFLVSFVMRSSVNAMFDFDINWFQSICHSGKWLSWKSMQYFHEEGKVVILQMQQAKVFPEKVHILALLWNIWPCNFFDQFIFFTFIWCLDTCFLDINDSWIL